MRQTNIAKAVLLAELEDVIRTMPERATIRHESEANEEWFGRAGAVMAACGQGMKWDVVYISVLGINQAQAVSGLRSLKTMLQQARHTLRLEVGPINSAFDEGRMFDYFDEVRKVIEVAQGDILFIDPYLDANFASRYLPHVRSDVAVRLLTTTSKLSTLLPAIELISKQQSLGVEVRLSDGLHDRYLIVDRTACYQSGASFKDGALKAPTTLTQITDAFAAVASVYEAKWASGKSA